MGGRAVLLQLASIGLLALIAVLLILVVIQNDDTQRKLEELRVDLKSRPTAAPSTPAANGSAGSPHETSAPQPASTPVTAPAGETKVEEYQMAGLRVRQSPYANPRAVQGDRLVRGYVSDPPGLNPFIFNEAMCSDLFGLCNDTLASRDFEDPERWELKLATSWTVRQAVRVYLTPDLDAREVVKQWQADPATAADLKAADIVELAAENEHTVLLQTDSVRGAYADWLATRLKAEQTHPVKYLMVQLNPKFAPPAGSPAVSYESLAQAIAAKQGAWRVLADRVRPAGGHQLLVLGDAAALAAAWQAALKAASPNFDAAKAETQCGQVGLLESQRYDVRPTVRFALRHGVRWQTIADPREGRAGQSIPGVEVTSADWTFTWNSYILNPQVPCDHYRNYLRDLDGITAPDAYTIEFAWFRPYFQLFTWSAGFPVLPRHIFATEDLTHPELSKFNRVICGNGPWKFKRWTTDVEIELERNPDYWGPAPHLNALVYKVVKDPTVNLSLFREGKLDFISTTSDQWRTFVGTPECEKIARTENGVANSYRYIGYNERKPLFSDKKVRRALTMLMDRKTIIEQIYNSLAVQLTGPFHPETPNTDPTVQPLPFDPAAAKRELAQAGWRDTDGDGVLDKDGVPFRYTLLYPSGRPEFDQIATLIQQNNRRAGIETELSKLDWAAFIGRINDLDFEACILGWQLGYESDPYQLWHSSQTEKQQSNFCGFKNKRADEIIVEARYQLDPMARQRLYREFHRLLAEEQPYTFLFVPKRQNLYSKRYEDVQYTMLGTDLNRWFVPTGMQR